MWRSGASGLGVPGAGKTWNLTWARRAKAVIAAPPSQHSSAGRVMTCPSAAVMLAASSRGRTASMVAPVRSRATAGAVAGDDDWDLLRRQTPLGGLAAPLARCSRQIAAFALEGFEDEGLVRLDDPGQARRLVEIERGQEPMSPPERGGVGHLAAFRGLRDRLAGDQRLRLVSPAIL